MSWTIRSTVEKTKPNASNSRIHPLENTFVSIANSPLNEQFFLNYGEAEVAIESYISERKQDSSDLGFFTGVIDEKLFSVSAKLRKDAISVINNKIKFSQFLISKLEKMKNKTTCTSCKTKTTYEPSVTSNINERGIVQSKRFIVRQELFLNNPDEYIKSNLLYSNIYPFHCVNCGREYTMFTTATQKEIIKKLEKIHEKEMALHETKQKLIQKIANKKGAKIGYVVAALIHESCVDYN